MGHVRAADRVDLLFLPRNRVNPIFAWRYRLFLYSSDTVAIHEEGDLVKSIERTYCLCWNEIIEHNDQ